MSRRLAHLLGGHHYAACRGRAECSATYETRRLFFQPRPRHLRPVALLTIETIEGSVPPRRRTPRHLRITR